ncbi:hypothetical protein M378DRAFT_18246 [Amanita muscaria Koide BX008]|uniref:Uncharacterized protein n=1 Tax=Amanita muscaria (strain Koide BX008) TaxID=946122 RepID=A0A0C2WEV2_AMAMK|nr:hypothetical protein M378DRAFT_18246 [Amanita muscaria Koide BX008]
MVIFTPLGQIFSVSVTKDSAKWCENDSSYLTSSLPSKSVKIPPFNFTVGNEGNPPNLAQHKGDIFTLTNRRIVCSKGTWFYDDNSTEVHRSEWWAEKGANERPPHSLLYKEKLYYEKRQIDYFPQVRLWAYIDQTTSQPLTDEDYEGVKPRTFQEFEQLAEKALPDEIVDEFIQSERNLHKKRQQEAALPPHKAARSNLQVVLHHLSYKEKQLYQSSWPVPQSPQIIQQFPERLNHHNCHPKAPSHNPKEKHNLFRDPLINKEIKEQEEEDYLTTDQNLETK